MTEDKDKARYEAEGYARYLEALYEELSKRDKDPDLALRMIRTLVDHGEGPEAADALIAWVRYLDVHLREGGHLPRDWQRKETPDQDHQP